MMQLLRADNCSERSSSTGNIGVPDIDDQMLTPTQLLSLAIKKRRSLYEGRGERDFRREILNTGMISKLCIYLGEGRAKRRRNRRWMAPEEEKQQCQDAEGLIGDDKCGSADSADTEFADYLLDSAYDQQSAQIVPNRTIQNTVVDTEHREVMEEEQGFNVRRNEYGGYNYEEPAQKRLRSSKDDTETCSHEDTHFNGHENHGFSQQFNHHQEGELTDSIQDKGQPPELHFF